MTAEILSLSKARKARARAAREQTAAENRIRFGRTKSEKQRDKAAAARRMDALDGHRLGTSDGHAGREPEPT